MCDWGKCWIINNKMCVGIFSLSNVFTKGWWMLQKGEDVHLLWKVRWHLCFVETKSTHSTRGRHFYLTAEGAQCVLLLNWLFGAVSELSFLGTQTGIPEIKPLNVNRRCLITAITSERTADVKKKKREKTPIKTPLCSLNASQQTSPDRNTCGEKLAFLVVLIQTWKVNCISDTFSGLCPGSSPSSSVVHLF